jgi:PAS domain S-box-containing protein
MRFYGVGKDITERKHTEEALRRSEERFSKVFHSSPIPIAISTVAEGRVIDVNESCHTALGFQRHEMIGHTIWELQFWVDNAEREQLLKLLHQQGAIRQQEFKFRTKGGDMRHALGSFEIIELNGEPCLLTFWLDISERIQAEQALIQSEERFYKAFHANPLAITLNTFGEGRIVDVNESFLQLFGYSRQELIGYTTVELKLWADNSERITLRRILREQGTLRQAQTKVRTKSGKLFPILLSVEVIEIGGQDYLLGMVQDISEIKRAEEVEREQRLFAEALRDVAAALNSTLDMEAVLDQILTHVGHVVPYDAATIMLIDGNEAHVVRSKGFTERGVEQIVKELRFPVDPTIKSSQVLKEQPLSIIEDTQTHQGWIDIPELRWIRSVVSSPIRAGGEVIGFLDLIYTEPGAFTAHRAERLQAFASQASTAIHNAQLFEQLRHLTQEMVSVQEEERRRISRELHDEAGQALIALKMSLEAIKQIPPHEMDALNTRLTDAIRLTDTTMELIRLLAQNLRPAVLDTLGLHLALQSHCHDFARRTGLHVVYTGMDIPRLTDAITTSLYRFVQEALTNVAKHSKATQVRVDLQYDVSIIRLSVEDNGQGLDSQAMPSNQKQGVGLIGIQERLRSVNGWLEINSAPIHGLRLLACIPWESES